MNYTYILNEGRGLIYKKSNHQLVDYFLNHKKNQNKSIERALELINDYIYHAERKYDKIYLKNVYYVKEFFMQKNKRLEDSKEKKQKKYSSKIPDINNKQKKYSSKIPNINKLLSNKASIKDIYDLKSLSSDKINYQENLEGGCNDSKILTDGFKGVFKSMRGEAPNARMSIPGGTYYKREIAAYELDRILDVGLVPPTTLRTEITDSSGKTVKDIGSIQKWEEGTAYCLIDDSLEDKINIIDKQKMSLLDFIMFNEDRHAGNFLVKKDGHLVAIDNGFCFGEDNDRSEENAGSAEEFRDAIKDGHLTEQSIKIIKNFKNFKKLRSLVNNGLLTEISYKRTLGRMYKLVDMLKYSKKRKFISLDWDKDYIYNYDALLRKASKEINNKKIENVTIEYIENEIKQKLIEKGLG